jgi:DNA-binding MarR family transcriptional regulator
MRKTPSASRSSRSKSRSAAQPERRLSLLLRLVAAHQRMALLVQRELAADGVEDDGYAVLSLIGVRGPVRLTEVARDLGLPLTTASDVVRRLEGRREVRRRANPSDGRSSLFELTAVGTRRWRRGFGALQRINEALARELDDPAATDLVLQELDGAFERALTED